MLTYDMRYEKIDKILKGRVYDLPYEELMEYTESVFFDVLYYDVDLEEITVYLADSGLEPETVEQALGYYGMWDIVSCEDNYYLISRN